MEHVSTSKVVVRAHNTCFFCLKMTGETELPNYNQSFSIRMISQYLKMNVDNIFKLTETPIFAKSLNSETEVEVRICSSCTAEMGRFTALYRSLEAIQIELINVTQKIRDLMVKAGEDQENGGIMSSGGNLINGIIQTSLFHNLRKETIKKCNTKLKVQSTKSGSKSGSKKVARNPEPDLSRNGQEKGSPVPSPLTTEQIPISQVKEEVDTDTFHPPPNITVSQPEPVTLPSLNVATSSIRYQSESEEEDVISEDTHANVQEEEDQSANAILSFDECQVPKKKLFPERVELLQVVRLVRDGGEKSLCRNGCGKAFKRGVSWSTHNRFCQGPARVQQEKRKQEEYLKVFDDILEKKRKRIEGSERAGTLSSESVKTSISNPSSPDPGITISQPEPVTLTLPCLTNTSKSPETGECHEIEVENKYEMKEFTQKLQEKTKLPKERFNSSPPKKKVMKCSICGRDYFDLALLQKHKLIHTPQNVATLSFTCPHSECSAKYNYFYHLRVHILKHHPLDKLARYVAKDTSELEMSQILQKTLATCKEERKWNMRDVHLCKICGKECATVDEVDSHVLASHFAYFTKRLGEFGGRKGDA